MNTWHGALPNGWQLQRAKRLFKKGSRPFDETSEVVTCFRDGQVTLRKNRRLTGFTESTQWSGYQGVCKGDLVIHVMDAFAGAIGVSDSDGKCTPVYSCCTPIVDDVNNYYYAYLLREMARSGWIQALSRGIRERSSDFRYEVFAAQYLPHPPLGEQNQIVRYLDWKVSGVNRLINAKKKQIALLTEMKRAVVNAAVTRGGERWTTVPLKRLLVPVSERNRPDLPLLSVVREQGIILRNVEDKEENHNFIPDDLNNYKVVHSGQFVMNKMKAWQGSYGVSLYDGIVSPAYYVFDLKFEYKDFFHRAIRCRYYVEKFAQFSLGIRIGQWDFPLEKIKEIEIFTPPLEEQKSIVTEIDTQFITIDKLTDKTTTEISLLHEYRTRLISDVVTGKLDVSGIVVPEYEMIEESANEVDINGENEEVGQEEE